MISRGLLLLAFCTTIVVVGCWFAIEQRYQQAEPQRRQGALVFPEFQRQLSRVAKIEVARAGGRFTLVADAGGWANRGIGGYPAISARVSEALVAMAGLRYIEPKTQRSNLHSRLDVADVVATSRSTGLTLQDASGAVLADLIVGKARGKRTGFTRAGTYIRLAGEARAWLVAGTLDVRYDAADWSEREVIDIAAGELLTLTLKQADGGQTVLYRQKSDDRRLTVRNLPPGAKVEHQYQIDYVAGLLRNVRLSDARRAGSAELEKAPAFEAVAHTADHLVVTLRAGEPTEDGSVWASFDAVLAETSANGQAREEANRINSGLRGWLLKLPRTVTDRLSIRLEDIIRADEPAR